MHVVLQSSTVADTRHSDLAESRKTVLQSLRQTRKGIADARKTIADGLQTVARLSRQLNSLAYISLVPDEVLWETFFQCVCKHIRTAKRIPFECLDCQGIVQHSPRLWTFISAGEGMWSMKQALTISGRVPLQVYFDAGYFDDWRFFGSRSKLATKAMRTIFKRLHRTQDLTFAKWTDFMARSLSQYATSEAPVLRRLVVSNCLYFGEGRSDRRGEDRSSSGGEYLSFILSQQCPQLTSLTFDGFAIESIRPSMLPALQELRFEPRASSSTVDNMVALLYCLPHLKILHLRQWDLESEDSEPTVKIYSSSKRVLALPHLRSLSLKGYPAIILRMLDPPLAPDANLVIAFATWCRIPEVTGAETEILSRCLNTRMMPGTDTKAVRVVVPDYRGCDMEIEIRHQSDRYQSYAPFLFHTLATNCLHSLLKLCEMVGSPDIRDLALAVAHPNVRFEMVLSEGHQWSALIQLTPLLEVMNVQGENRCIALCKTLNSAESAWPLSSLRKLFLCLLPDCRRLRGESERAVEVIGSLVSALTTGKEHGWALQELHFDLGGLLAEDALTPLADLLQDMTIIHAKEQVVDSKVNQAIPSVPRTSSNWPELPENVRVQSPQPDKHASEGCEAAEVTSTPDEDTEPKHMSLLTDEIEAMTSDSDMDSDLDVDLGSREVSPSRRRRSSERRDTEFEP